MPACANVGREIGSSRDPIFGRPVEVLLADAIAAERIARDEATRLRAEIDALRHRSLWQRVRNR